MLVGICAIRSPTDAAVVFTYFAIVLRLVAVFGLYCRKEIAYVPAGAGEALINIILFFITLTHSPY